MSDTKKGKVFTDEHKANLSKAAKKRKPNGCKKVVCNGITYKSMSALAKHLGVSISAVSAWKRGINPIPEHLDLTFTIINRGLT
jgi:hypothetical protein